MKLQYLGCSAFIITSSGGTGIGIDFWNKSAFPYAEDTPEDLNVGIGDIKGMLVSHDHPDHCRLLEGVEPYYGVEDNRVIDNENALKIDDIIIGKYNSMHFHPDWKIAPKANTVFKLTVDGMSILHMGDSHGTMVEKPLLEELKSRVGHVDILLMPIGTPWLKKFKTEEVLVDVIKVMDAKIIVPMHYWKVEDKEGFLSEVVDHVDNIERFEKNEVNLLSKDLDSVSGKVIWSIPAGKLA